MSHYAALLDANVLYPAPLRDLLLELAVTDIYKANWSADIHREWIEALLRNEPHRDRLRLKHPPYTIDEYLDTLIRQGLPATVSGLRALAAGL